MKKLVLIMLIFSFFASFSQDELIINDAVYEKNNNYDFILGNKSCITFSRFMPRLVVLIKYVEENLFLIQENFKRFSSLTIA